MFSKFRPFIASLIEKMNIREPKKTLGRWSIDTCPQKMSRKVDQSNEDHCGPCGYTVQDPIPSVPKKYWYYDKTVKSLFSREIEKHKDSPQYRI
jgi:hypothetical protein